MLCYPTGTHGLTLLCNASGFQGQVIVTEYAALDRDQFWRMWRAFGGARQGLVYEDGTPFRSPGEPAPRRRTVLGRIRAWIDRLLEAVFPSDD